MSYVPPASDEGASERRSHSRLGLASFFIAVGFPLLIIFMLVLWSFFPDAKSPAGSAYGNVLLVTWFIVAPVGHLIGLILGVVGLFSKKRKRLFAVLGFILNIAIVIFGLILAFWLLAAAVAFH